MPSNSLLEDVLRCRYPVDKSIHRSGFGWDTPRLNEVIAAHTANLARPVDESDFYGVADAIAQALRDCEGEDPDTCSLSPKTRRRLRMALTAALANDARGVPDPEDVRQAHAALAKLEAERPPVRLDRTAGVPVPPGPAKRTTDADGGKQ